MIKFCIFQIYVYIYIYISGEISSVGFGDSSLISLGRLAQWNERRFLKQQTGVRFRPSVVRYNWAAPLWKEFSSCQHLPYDYIYLYNKIEYRLYRL